MNFREVSRTTSRQPGIKTSKRDYIIRHVDNQVLSSGQWRAKQGYRDEEKKSKKNSPTAVTPGRIWGKSSVPHTSGGITKNPSQTEIFTGLKHTMENASMPPKMLEPTSGYNINPLSG